MTHPPNFGRGSTVFGQPRPRLNVRAVIRDVLDEEHGLRLVLGQNFLNERLDNAEARLTRWQHYLATISVPG